jgi:hypothetical protein rflaF_10017
MALTKHKLGELIEQVDERNTDRRYGLESVRGISIEKKFIHTKADMSGVSLEGYKLVGCHQFAYVPITSRNSDKITLAHNLTNETYLISSTYIAFEVKRPDLVCDEYLFLFFNRSEFDRLARFSSWGSARESLSWVDLCDVDIELPPLDVQRKYVKIYQAMKENLAANMYSSSGSMVHTATTILGASRSLSNVISYRLGELIELVDERNDLGIRRFYGLNKAKQFMPTAASTDSLDERKYKVVRKGRFAFTGMQTGRDEVIRISLYQQEEPIIVSPAYTTFEVVKTDVILPEYLFMVFRSPEMDRYGWFVSDSSVRSNLDWDVFCDIEIQLPPLDVQRKYVAIHQGIALKQTAEARINKLMNSVCPVLVRGALLEGERMEVS